MQNNECIYICEQYTDYQEGSLSTEIKARVEAHLASCSPCQHVFKELSDVLTNLQSLPKKQASPDFTANLMSRVESLNSVTPLQKFYKSSYMRVAGYAIAAGLVVAIGLNMLIDPIAPMNPNGPRGFTGEQNTENTQQESLAEATDSSLTESEDSLQVRSTPINSNNQSLQLVSDTK